MYWLKQCPKCKGDLVSDHDQYGDYISCLQCGMCRDIVAAPPSSPIAHSNPVQLSAGEALSSETDWTIPALVPVEPLTAAAH
jgi:uncharacterized protein YbaR (Trm112 family)